MANKPTYAEMRLRERLAEAELLIKIAVGLGTGGRWISDAESWLKKERG